MQDELLDMSFLDPLALCKRLGRYFKKNLSAVDMRVFRMKGDGIGIDILIGFSDGDIDYMRVCDIWAQYNVDDILVGYTIHNSLVEQDTHKVYGYGDMLSKIKAMILSHRNYIIIKGDYA
jgi:hypothetical protein